MEKKGLIVNYRGSHKTKRKPNQMVVMPAGAKGKEDSKELIGARVTWTNGKTSISGTATHFHGAKGALRVRFDRGLPGESVGTQVKISK
ncbi:MAG: 50S ribosomal protein L35ae [archaeon]